MAMDQYLYIPFLGDEHPFTSYFDVHQGDRVLTHPHMFQKCHASLRAGGFTTRESQARLLGHASEVVAQGNRFLRSSKHMKRSKNKALIYWTIYLSVCLSIYLSIYMCVCEPSVKM